MFINKVTMHIMINLIQMLLIFVFEIRPRDRLQNDSDAMTVLQLSPFFRETNDRNSSMSAAFPWATVQSNGQSSNAIRDVAQIDIPTLLDVHTYGDRLLIVCL